MQTELQMLVYAIGLGFIQLFLATGAATAEQGLDYNVSARDTTPPPLHGVAGRMNRAFQNFKETFPMFAAAILLLAVTQTYSHISALGAVTYLIARLVYIPVYAAGIKYVRTLVWLVSIIGIAMVLYSIIMGASAPVLPAL